MDELHAVSLVMHLECIVHVSTESASRFLFSSSLPFIINRQLLHRCSLGGREGGVGRLDVGRQSGTRHPPASMTWSASDHESMGADLCSTLGEGVTKAVLGVGAGRVAPSCNGGPGYHPRKIAWKFYMQNGAFWGIFVR